jgi:biopolymer transport protein ExbD
MKRSDFSRLTHFLLIASLSLAGSKGAFAKKTPEGELNTARIEELTGLKGSLSEDEGVFKVSSPRDDLNVQAAGVSITPPLGLTSWAAFKKTGDQAMVMVMGDIVMTEDQVNSVMDAALNNGLEVTALHNHFFWDKPKVMFMHIGGMANEEALASAVGKVFATLKSTIKNPPKVPSASINPSRSDLNTKKIAETIGTAGELNKGVYKITIGRSTKMHGFEMGKAMGVNTWAAFAGTDQSAVVDGDFAMLEDELQGVLKALRQNGINVVAIHNHMTHEVPRIIFLHYWGIGTAANLAKGVKAALNTQK